MGTNAFATETVGSSFLNGVEQFTMVSLPPAGVYYLLQAVEYDADELRGNDGQRINIPFRKKI